MTVEETLVAEALVPFALNPDRKAPAPEALQTVAGGKRRAATTGGEARRAATGRKDETHTAPAGRKKEWQKGSRRIRSPTEDSDLKTNA